MKNLFLPLFALLFLFSCSKNYRIVDADYSYYGNFDEYESYNFMNNMGTASHENSVDEAIEAAIRQRMEIQGFTINTKDPNLLIIYKIYFNDLQFKGYSQPQIGFWIENQEETVELYDPIKFQLTEGSLVIQLFDREKKRTVWQGYTSGLFHKNADQLDQEIKKAVRSIFDKYNFTASGFMASGR